MGCNNLFDEAKDKVFTPSGMRETGASRVKRINEAVSLLKGLIADDNADDNYHALLGVAYYFLLGDDITISSEDVIYELNLALNINRHNIYALMYLAFQKFDDSCYGDALDLIEKTKINADYQAVENWQRLKIEEIELSCRIFCNPKAVLASEIVDFCEKMLASERDDRAPILELLKALKILELQCER